MSWLVVILMLCALAGGTDAKIWTSGPDPVMPDRYRQAHPAGPEARATPSPHSTDGASDPVLTEYTQAITDQRTQVETASAIIRDFLLDPNSLDQRKRVSMLQAIATLHANVDAADALEPPPGLEALHARHLESLETLALAGTLYTTGMDTHDPSQYDRADEALDRGSKLFEKVGAEIETLTPSQ